MFQTERERRSETLEQGRPLEHGQLEHGPLEHGQFTHDGQVRRTGFEIEFGGLTIEQAAKVLVCHLGGYPNRIHKYKLELLDCRLGDVRLEMDMKLLQDAAARPATGTLEVLRNQLLDQMTPLMGDIIPLELITDPLTPDQLPVLETTVIALRNAGALGTAHSWHHAFGLHINSEVPALNSRTILAYMQSYALLQDQLAEALSPNLTRKLAGVARPWPEWYLTHILRPDYRPDMMGLMRDYMAYNPTRNRALDMLPLFSHIDRGLVRAHIDDPRVNGRPAFHFRLPNCRIDEADWSIAAELQHWQRVEELARNHRLRHQLLLRWRQDHAAEKEPGVRSAANEKKRRSETAAASPGNMNRASNPARSSGRVEPSRTAHREDARQWHGIS